jgi:Tol biopolymer transport system component
VVTFITTEIVQMPLNQAVLFAISQKDPNYLLWLYSLSETQKKAITGFFGAKVDVTVSSNGKGKIAIPFHSEEDFNRILKLIKG